MVNIMPQSLLISKMIHITQFSYKSLQHNILYFYLPKKLPTMSKIHTSCEMVLMRHVQNYPPEATDVTLVCLRTRKLMANM